MTQAARKVVLFILRAYKWALSPFLLPACRYVPSCSEYALEAVDRYGVFRGGTMATGRLLRCHPFVRGGYDPVVKSGNSDFMINFKSNLTPQAFPDNSAVADGTDTE